MSPNDPRSAVLHHWLDASLKFAPEYGQGLSNHLPMALAALHGLGAGEARLQAFFTQHARMLVPEAATAAVDSPDDWLALRGQLPAYGRLRAGFAARLARDGRDALLRDTLAPLIAGVGAAAFHGVIRTAHAVESGHGGELAAALAYWAARWMPLQPPTSPRPADLPTVAAWLLTLETRLTHHDLTWRPRGPMISGRMQDAARTAVYHELAGRLRTDAGDIGELLHELALCAAACYAATGNFTVLHLATGTRAARVLAPWWPSEPAALAPWWHAVAAAFMASGVVWGRPGQDNDDDDHAFDWPRVIDLALRSDDEHVIKIVHTLWMQQSVQADPVWLGAANRAVRQER